MTQEINTDENIVTATAEQISITDPTDKKETIAELVRHYPKTFFLDPKQRKPLMVGIKNRLIEALPELPKTVLEKTLKYYCFSMGYLRSFEHETHRYDLNGEPVAELTETDKVSAKSKMEAVKKMLPKKLKPNQKSESNMAERETLTLKIKPTPKAEPAKPASPSTATSDTVKASAKSAKITLVLDTHSISRINSEGKKQVKLVIQVGEMKFTADLNSKSYRKALATIDELGAENCNAILQGSMPKFGELDGVGLVIQPKKAKEEQATK